MKKKLNNNIIEVMAAVPRLKKKARKAGLYASFIPIVGAVELTTLDGEQIGISFDGTKIRVNGHYHDFEKYLLAFGAVSRFLQKNFHAWKN